MTIVFADLVGSTALASDQDPERTRLLLDRFYVGMAEEVRRVGGTLEKFVGDAVMAVFGAPVAYEDHAERALHAALAMQRRLRELFGERLALRIGVNTGEVAFGQPHGGGSFVSGDPVNVAARLEQAAAAGEILTGERTVAAVGSALEFGPPRSIEAKGKAGGVTCRPLVRALSLMRPRGVGALRGVFVGRERELTRLLNAYRRTAERRSPQVVTVLGDAGVGKTRLVRELWEALALEAEEPLRRVGRCMAYGRSSAYQPLGEILREHFAILESDVRDDALSKLRDREILGLSLGLDVAGDLHPLAVRERFREAWSSFLADLVAERPAVVLIEDLHWADGALVEVLALSARVRGPLLLLATARPEAEPLPNGDVIRLEPLAGDDPDLLLAALLGAEPPRGVRALVEQAEGNPFFIEEMLATLIDRELLVAANGGWALQELPSEFALPDSVRALLAARIDLLPQTAKATLQAGAVIGRVFRGDAVDALTDGETELELLQARGFVHRRSSTALADDAEYAIRHALTREVAYSGIPKARRARLHLAFAEWLEPTGEGRDEHAAALAHHYGEALREDYAELAWPDDEEAPRRLRPKAVVWLGRAAALAVGRYEIEEALSLLGRALRLAPADEVRARLWREVGRANSLKFDGEAFWTAMERSLAVDPEPTSRAETYSMLAFETSSRGAMWRTRPATETVERWVERALSLADRGSAAHVRALVAKAYWDPVSGEDCARDANALAERLSDGEPELRSVAWGALAAAAFEQARFEEACAWTQRRLERLREIDDPDRVAEVLELAMPAMTGGGRLQEGRQLVHRLEEVAQRLSPHHRVHAVAQAVDVDELAGDWTSLRDRTPLVEERVEANLATPCVRNARALLLCALAWLHGGNEERARELERRADELGMVGYGYALDSPRAQIALIRGDRDVARRLLQERPAKTYTIGPGVLAARLDGLAALRDRARVEVEAAPLLGTGGYLEPFAQRALGVVRGDNRLLDHAVARLEALELDWHAEQTRVMRT